MNSHALVEAILEQNRRVLKKVPGEDVERFIQELDKAERVFCAAVGRSGYVLRCFCQRLMQLGYRVFFVGETVTPNIENGDLLVVLSGSGQTPLPRQWVRIARENQARSCGIIGVQDSPIGRDTDCRLTVPAGSNLGIAGTSGVNQPPRSLFEQAAFLLMEMVVLILCNRRGIDPSTIMDRHANIE